MPERCQGVSDPVAQLLRGGVGDHGVLRDRRSRGTARPDLPRLVTSRERASTPSGFFFFWLHRALLCVQACSRWILLRPASRQYAPEPANAVLQGQRPVCCIIGAVQKSLSARTVQRRFARLRTASRLAWLLGILPASPG